MRGLGGRCWKQSRGYDGLQWPFVSNFAKVFELIPTAQQNDHNVAIDIVKSWGRRAASYELEALVESEWTFSLGGRAAKPRLSTTAPANKERTRI